MLRVGEGVTNHSIQEVIDIIANMMMSCEREALDTSSSSQPAYGSIRNNGVFSFFGLASASRLRPAFRCNFPSLAFACHDFDYKIYSLLQISKPGG